MIVLHRLGQTDHPFHLNCDLIFTVEATPDTVVTLTTGVKVVVAESPEEVCDRVREWRVDIMTEALNRRRPRRTRSARSRSSDAPSITAVDSESNTA